MGKNFLSKQNFIPELKLSEHIILWTNVVISIIFFLIQMIMFTPKDTLGIIIGCITCIMTILSIFSVMAGVKKRILCPFLGIVCSLGLVFVAWYNGLYGNMIMYTINIVINTSTLIVWFKSSENKINIEPKQAIWWICIIYFLFFLSLSVLFTWIQGFEWFYKFWNNKNQDGPSSLWIRFFDSCTLIFTLGCFLPMIKRYKQVWYVYIIIDTSLLITWILKITIDDFSKATLLNGLSMIASSISMLITTIFGILNWSKKSK